ncbi:MAG: HlyD family efflux transporter periplasmic adaptor subunit [Cyanothece sp. SIO2G6]|nr:HlyD family efflux transporter periplasmic adaptor subunit [Cyanothece sp. SIO2G6]
MVNTLKKSSQTQILSQPKTSEICPPSEYTLPDLAPRPALWKRITVGSLFWALGLGAATIGLTSIYYRLSHITIDSGIVNGRTVRVQSPINGTLEDFYGRPGAQIQAGQVLAKLEPLPQEGLDNQLNITRLRQKVEVAASNLKLAQQTLTMLTQQKSTLAQQDRQFQSAMVTIAADDIARYEAALDEAIANEEAANSTYQRHQMLLDEGAIAAQRVDELRAEWKVAQASVQAAQAALASARTTLAATQNSVPVQSSIDDLQEQQQTLQQRIQDQTVRVEQLRLDLENRQAELEELEVVYTQDSSVEITAPFTGVIHTTRHETGEEVSRPATLLTVLDCNDLWVETLVSIDQAHRIDVEKPVRVDFAGTTQTITGEVTLIEAMTTGKLTEARTEAILPAVSANLIGQPLARVRVNVPPTDSQFQAHQFCGLGQSARLTFATDF